MSANPVPAARAEALLPVVLLSRRYRFSASHRLHVDALAPEANREMFGKCNNPFGHGHNYFVEVTFSGPVDPETGMVTDLGALDAFAQRELLDPWNYSNLNTMPAFRDIVPTTENVCHELWRVFLPYAPQARSPRLRLVRVYVEETGNNSFEYLGEEVPAYGPTLR